MEQHLAMVCVYIYISMCQAVQVMSECECLILFIRKEITQNQKSRNPCVYNSIKEPNIDGGPRDLKIYSVEFY